MSIHLPPELESRIEEEVRSGRFTSSSDLVDTAVREFLLKSAPVPGKFRELRRKIEESGIPLLTDEELELEIQSRRGSRY
ncbi:MAG: CopG family transcriptional regulator [Acidobacteria bacterium]|nr:CopG family transcriptional regulator [Acidobacteriota bacterium]